MRKLLLLLSVVLATPLFAAIGPEFALAPPVIGAAPGMQAGASIASDGSTFFAVWQDTHAGSRQLIGARVTADGTPLDILGVPLPTKNGSIPFVVWAGSNYLVVWSEGDTNVRVARLSPDGIVLDPEPHDLLPEPSFLKAVASDGSRTAIAAWKNGTSSFVTIVDPDGAVVATVDLPPLASTESMRDLDVAWNGTDFVVAQALVPQTCSACGNVERVSFISPDGVIRSSVDTPASLFEGTYTIAALPDRFIVAAATWTKGYNAWIFTNDGRPVGGTLGFAWNNTASAPVSVIAEDSSFVLMWPESKSTARLLAMRMDSYGNANPVPLVLGSAMSGFFSPALAKNSAGAFVATWSASVTVSYDEQDVFARGFSSSLTPVAEPALLSRGASAQQQPAVGTNGSTWLVSWIEWDGNGRQLVARRFAPDGSALDASPLELAPVSTISGPAVASNGRDYIVAWVADNALSFRRLSSAGTWIDPAPRRVGTGAWGLSRQAIGWDGANYFIVWSRYSYSSNDPPTGVVGSRIDADGNVSAPAAISPDKMPGNEPALARLGDRWLVVWTYMPPFPCQITCPGGDTDIVGARVTFDGLVVDPIPIQFSIPNALAYDYARSPMLVSSGDSVLVSWRANRQIRATRISSDGMIDGGVGGDGVPLLKLAGSYSDVSLGWDGRDYLLLASDPAIDSPTPVTLYRFEIPGALSEGEDLSVGWTPLVGGMYDIALGARPGGKAIAIYPRLTGAEYGGVNRLFARTIAARERVRPTKR